ncbi:MAG: Coenzyme F420 hydrogenase/dehydrogenase, beta subunit C-terminal domain [Candidatus Gastranaerophilales bacterium]|nr:Coenzyme F420 hydrogenase/dehydrogenase, beta subunit C-terminal domain [Candidatus Gastranaerophilales bacterium]
MDTIGVLDKNKCCGCARCANSCQSGAISMQTNEEGFLYPIIDDEKCTNCGLCTRNCPALNPQYLNNSNPKCFALMAPESLRSKSSSGAIFPIIAYHFIKKGAYVSGAIWDKNGIVKHIVSNNKDDIEKMRGSKYTQSEIRDVFSKIKELLKNNNEVLFTGTPCQIAGLKAYLGKNYDNLYTADLVCHGTPSPMVFKKYLEEQMQEDEEFVSTNFRNKINGWNPGLNTITTTVKSKKGTRDISYSSKEDDFWNAFLKNFCLRTSCNDCQFNKLPRQADITMGDFWGIGAYNKKMNDQKGTSLLLINNTKGEKLINEVKNSFKLFAKVPIKYAIKGNPVLTVPCKAHENKEIFYNDLKNIGLKKALNNALKTRYDGVILNFWFSATNYGAVFTAYCIQQFIKENFNKDFKLLNWKPDSWKKIFSNSFSEKFSKTHLSLTEEFCNADDMHKLNAYTDTFIVGSDQVFRYKYVQNWQDAYLLKFADYSKKKIALSASFGLSHFEGNQIETFEFNKALQRFDAISVREIDGVDICKTTFNIEAKHIIDPVFLVNKEKIEKLIEKDIKKYKGAIVTYVLDSSKEIEQKINSLAQKLNKNIISILDKNITMEEWLSALYSCDYIITDSFHGACCAILFKKKFICLKNKRRGTSRFETLEKTFNIKDNFIFNVNDIDNLDILNKEIDWQYADKVIDNYRQFAIEWLKEELNKEKNPNKIEAELNYLNNNKGLKFSSQKANKKKNEKFIEKIFSVKNQSNKNKTHKVIQIFGIKIKIKKQKR